MKPKHEVIMCFTPMFQHIVVLKIDENRCKQTLASLPCFGAYRSSQFTVIINLPQNTAYARGCKYLTFTRL